MSLFRVLWGIDIIAAAIAAVFFVWGVADGSVSEYNILLWIVLLGGLLAVVLGSRALHDRGQRALATAIAIVPALPTLGMGAMLLAAMIFGGPWH